MRVLGVEPISPDIELCLPRSASARLMKKRRLGVSRGAPQNVGMRVSDERIEDFLARWQSAFEETLSREEAHTIATQLLELGRRLRRPLPPEGAALLAELRASI